MAYVLTEVVPGHTVIAVDGCCCDRDLRGADAYLLHRVAQFWAPAGCLWVNDGPAASEGIKAHKLQHNGVYILRLTRYQCGNEAHLGCEVEVERESASGGMGTGESKHEGEGEVNNSSYSSNGAEV